ncbi:hypothetical protein B0O80DRAFT_528669 [Mortierella sp. GBAus27b]|nr:hypothetical protein B0O80DRAFT_528669 [Mortierella sp. GBAus27b]
MDALATLQQLDQECSSWARQHAHSCNLLASLINITRQRDQTLTQWQQQQQQQDQTRQLGQHLSQPIKRTTLLASSSLQLLIHKQTLEIEAVIQQLYETIEVFKKVVRAMTTLEKQVETAIQRIDLSKLVKTVSSSPTLLDTAEISPLEALDWVSRVRYMYAQELSLRQSQIHPSVTSLNRFESLVDLQRTWGLQKQIDFGLEQEIEERIKTYQRVRELSSRTSG